MAQTFTTRPEIRGTFGAVTSTHWLGTAVGMSMLERGGNAFDAAVATAFVLQIVEPHLNGPGGDAPIIAHRAGEPVPKVICGQGTAPEAATIEEYHRRGIKVIPGTGFLAAVVPGAFDAWMLLLRDYGTLPLRTVLEPAIGYAQNGFPLVHRAAAAIHAVADFFTSEWPTSAGVWLNGGHAPLSGEFIKTPEIASAYDRILAEAEAAGKDREAQIEAARKCFYEGFVAETIDNFCRETEVIDSSGHRNNGLLTGQDMAAWRASYEETLAYDYHGVSVHKTGIWGQGACLLQSLALLKGFDLDAMDPMGDAFIHTVTEAIKLAFIDRDIYYGDPDFADIPVQALLSDAYNDDRRKQIDDKASDEFRPGTLLGDEDDKLKRLLELAGSETGMPFGAGEPTFADIPEVEGDTVHLDAVDRWGNMVSATPSGGWLQSSPAIPGLGFNLPTRAQMFWLDDRLPSGLAPKKRPRTTLTPTMVTRDGAPYLAFGSPGGDQQDQWSLVFLLRVLHQKMNLQAAIDAPLFNSKHLISSFFPREATTNSLLVEDRTPEPTRRGLEKRGHGLNIQDSWSLGRLCAVSRGRTGHIRAAATPRFMQAYAAGR